MCTYARISTAVLISVLLHLALIFGITRHLQVRVPDMRGLLQVTLYPSLNDQNKHSVQAQPQLAKTTLSEINKPDLKPLPASRTVKSISEVPQPAQTPGQFRWRPPSTYPQKETMNAMQLERLAFQRQAQVAAVMAGLSTISSQLGSIITAKITCTQQTDDEMDCIPEPKENERALIVQFFNLALQAHRLGLTENPVRMDFGDTLGVSIMLR